MNLFKKGLVTLGTTVALAGAFTIASPMEAEAAAWEPRTVAEIKADFEETDTETQYTIRWGDTLGTIAAAFNVELAEIAKINEIANKDFIMTGNVLLISEDHQTVTIQDSQTKEVKSYDVSEPEAKEVEVTEEVQAAVEEPVEEAPAPVEPVQEEAVVEEAPAEASNSTQAAGEWMTFEATGYSTQQPQLSTHTYTGIDLRVNPRVIAVDPNVIPLGSTVEVEGLGTYVAGDTGSAINGRIIDIHYPTVQEALNWGRRNVRIRIVQ